MEEWIPLHQFVEEYMKIRSTTDKKNKKEKQYLRSEASIRVDAQKGNIEAKQEGRNWKINIHGETAAKLIADAEKSRDQYYETLRLEAQAEHDEKQRKNEVKNLNESVEQLRRELEECKAEIQQLNTVIDNRNNTIDELNSLIDNKNKTIDNLQHDIEVAQARYETAEHMAEIFTKQTTQPASTTPADKKEPRTKKNGGTQIERDREVLEQYEKLKAEDPKITKTQCAAILGMKRSTFSTLLKRAEEYRASNK